jgi:hypothetical protein
LSCLIQNAERNVANNEWVSCPTCKKSWEGQTSVGLARARVDRNSHNPRPGRALTPDEEEDFGKQEF